MRIMHLVSSLKRAGLEKLIYLLCRSNDSDNSNQFLVAVINDEVDKNLTAGIRQTKAVLVELKRTPGNPLSVSSYVFKIRKVISEYRPDVVHVHDNLSFLAGFFSTRFFGVRLAYTLHGLRLYSSSYFDRVSKWLAVKGTDRFIAISESVRKDFIGRSTRPGPVEVVPNCIDLKEFSFHENNKSVPAIVCVARLDHTVKGQDILINALSILKKRSIRCECRLIGEGPSRTLLEQMVEDMGLTDQVSFMGLRNDVAALLSQADLFVLPSRNEGFGIVILEAMASGLPVIVSNIEGPSEVVRNGIDGLNFQSGDASDLADKIEKLLTDKALRTRFAQASISRVRDYSIDSMYEAYLRVYRSIIDRQPVVKEPAVQGKVKDIGLP